MSKPQERQYPYNFGRVFFPSEPNPKPAIPNEIRFQTLGNHVSNVGKLVREWQHSDFPDNYESSFKRVIKAANLHDIGKPQKFALQVETDCNQKFKKYIYSFRGHRFLAECKDNLWVEKLAQGHHDFSVRDISRDAYVLNKYPEYKSILTKDPLAYARELYILEMCDQIEAELACRVIGDDEQAESRTFMDYTISPDVSEPLVYRIDPWIFSQDTIELTFKSWVFYLSEDDKYELEKCLSENRDSDLGKKLDTLVKNWWEKQQGKPEKIESKTVTLKRYSSIEQFQNRDCPFWYQQLAGFAPNPMQADIFEQIDKTEAPAILLKAPTGSGKFEAVLFPALAKGYRLILPLPARSLIEDQKQRAEKYLQRLSEIHPEREFSLVIDTGSQMQRWVYRNGKEEPKPRTYNPRRHLYKGDVILTTLDKFLYRYFSFGDKQKSFVFPLRINRDKTHSEKTLICFDEAHSYDNISFTNFQSLVQSLYEAGRSLVLMTATMPQQHIDRFDYLEVIDYIKNPENVNALREFQQQSYETKAFEWLNEVERDSNNPQSFQITIAQIVLKEWKSKPNRRIIAVVQTVKDAVAIYQQVKNELGSNNDNSRQFLFLYHGRISDIPKDSEFSRSNRYKNLKNRDENNQPYILITTSAIEVGCDLNSEILISEICPPENLIQRAGRCNRRGNVSDAKVILVGNKIQEFANTLDESGWETYQETLQQLTDFNTTKISKCIWRSPHVNDYRVVELFSMLHDYVYGADLTCQPAHEKGLVVTRSWTPSATLVYDDSSQTELKDMPQVTIPIDSLILKKDNSNQYANTHVYERYYDQENTSWELRDLRWGFAYQKDIIIKINNQEYDYNPDLGFVELPGIFIKLKTTGCDQKLLYQYDNSDGKKSVIITYTKALEDITQL